MSFSKAHFQKKMDAFKTIDELQGKKLEKILATAIKNEDENLIVRMISNHNRMKEIIQILFSENASSRMLATIFSKLTDPGERSIFVENLLKYDRLDFFQLFSSKTKDKKSFNKWLMNDIFTIYNFSHQVGFYGAMKILNFLLSKDNGDVGGSWIITQISKCDLLKGFVDSPLKNAVDNVEEYLSQFPEKYSPGSPYDHDKIDASSISHKFKSVEMCKKMLVHIERIIKRDLTRVELTSIAAANHHNDSRNLEILTFIFDLYNQRNYDRLVTNFRYRKYSSKDYDFHLLSILMKYSSDDFDFSDLRDIFIEKQKSQETDDVLFQFTAHKISLEKILSIDISFKENDELGKLAELVNLSISRVAQVTEQLHSSTNLISPIVDIILLYL